MIEYIWHLNSTPARAILWRRGYEIQLTWEPFYGVVAMELNLRESHIMRRGYEKNSQAKKHSWVYDIKTSQLLTEKQLECKWSKKISDMTTMSKP